MISAISSGSSSPVSIYNPLPEIQNSPAIPSSEKRIIRTGIADCRDSFESSPSNHQQPYKNPIINPVPETSALAAVIETKLLSMIRV